MTGELMNLKKNIKDYDVAHMIHVSIFCLDVLKNIKKLSHNTITAAQGLNPALSEQVPGSSLTR
jgi:hypothetical protein